MPGSQLGQGLLPPHPPHPSPQLGTDRPREEADEEALQVSNTKVSGAFAC